MGLAKSAADWPAPPVTPGSSTSLAHPASEIPASAEAEFRAALAAEKAGTGWGGPLQRVTPASYFDRVPLAPNFVSLGGPGLPTFVAPGRPGLPTFMAPGKPGSMTTLGPPFVGSGQKVVLGPNLAWRGVSANAAGGPEETGPEEEPGNNAAAIYAAQANESATQAEGIAAAARTIYDVASHNALPGEEAQVLMIWAQVVNASAAAEAARAAAEVAAAAARDAAANPDNAAADADIAEFQAVIAGDKRNAAQAAYETARTERQTMTYWRLGGSNGLG